MSNEAKTDEGKPLEPCPFGCRPDNWQKDDPKATTARTFVRLEWHNPSNKLMQTDEICRVECYVCGASQPSIEAWNRRLPFPTPSISKEEVARRIAEEIHSAELGSFGLRGFGLDRDELYNLLTKHLPSQLGREQVREQALEEAARIADEFKMSNNESHARACNAGRENVASHRQSDAETSADIAAAIRALKSNQVGTEQ